VEFVSDNKSLIVLRGHWCDVLNTCAPTEDNIDDSKDSFNKKLAQAFE
jgi:hypothetical protein